MLVELGTGVLAALLLEINAGALVLMLGACGANDVTAWLASIKRSNAWATSSTCTGWHPDPGMGMSGRGAIPENRGALAPPAP